MSSSDSTVVREDDVPALMDVAVPLAAVVAAGPPVRCEDKTGEATIPNRDMYPLHLPPFKPRLVTHISGNIFFEFISLYLIHSLFCNVGTGPVASPISCNPLELFKLFFTSHLVETTVRYDLLNT